MSAVISWCTKLCLFRATPSSLPQSRSLLYAAVLLASLLFVLSMRWQVSWSTSLVVTGYIIVTQFALVYAVLAVAGRKQRFLKTITAVLIASMIFQVLAFPALVILSNNRGMSPVLMFSLETLVMFIQVWLMFVHAHILNCALEVGQLVAFLLVLAISMVQLRFLGIFIGV